VCNAVVVAFFSVSVLFRGFLYFIAASVGVFIVLCGRGAHDDVKLINRPWPDSSHYITNTTITTL